MSKILNRLCKWRAVFAGWQLGSRPKTDPEAAAVRDATDARLLMRVEITALVALLVQKGMFTATEFAAQTEVEAECLMELLEKKFPGFRATDDGIMMDPQIAQKTTAGWKP